MIPHNTPAERKQVNVTLDGEKVGTATVSKNGTLSVMLTSNKVVELMAMKREIQHLSIIPKFKEN